MTALPDDTRSLIERAGAGDGDAFRSAFTRLYEELARLAHAHRVRWTGDLTVGTTVLIHETFLKVAGTGDMAASWTGRRHFFALASRVMRQVLVDHADQRRATKRGGGAEVVPLEDAPESALAIAADDSRILALHEALDALAAREPRQAQVIECRFFGGLSIPETAEALGLSPATVKRDWLAASSWLHTRLSTVGG